MKTLFSKLILVAGLAMFMATPMLNAQTHKYVGADKCKNCHRNDHRSWEQGAHAKAYANLGDKKNDASCLKCHSTAGSVDASLHSGITQSEGVSCESCHGAASAYGDMRFKTQARRAADPKAEMESKGMIASPGKAVCMNCHDPKKQPADHKGEFDFEKWKEKMTHP